MHAESKDYNQEEDGYLDRQEPPERRAANRKRLEEKADPLGTDPSKVITVKVADALYKKVVTYEGPEEPILLGTRAR